MTQIFQKVADHWFKWSIVLMIGLFSLTQLSNANTYLVSLQKPGNYHDDSRLTNAVNASSSYSEVSEHIKFVRSHTISAYIFKTAFGVESHGRRIISCFLILLSLIYLTAICIQYQVLDRFGAVALIFITGLSGELTVYTSTGLTAYPLSVALFSVLLHILVKYHSRELSKSDLVIINVVFVVATVLMYRTIVGVCAVAAVICFGDNFKYLLSVKQLMRRVALYFAIVTLPALVAVVIIYLDTPFEFMNPHRSLHLYFFESDYPKTLMGGIEFFAYQSWQLFNAAVSPNILLINKNLLPYINAAMAVFFVTGVISSWNKKSFGIVLFLAAGVLGHIILNLLTALPFGNLRYFLTFFIPVILVTAIGFSFLANSITRLKFKNLTLKPDALLFFVTIISVGLLSNYALLTIRKNSLITNKTMVNVSNILYANKAYDSGIVIDIWTADTLKADFKQYNWNQAYLFKSNRKTSRRKNPAGSSDDLQKWRKHLAGLDSISLITSIPFNEEYFGKLFLTAGRDFNVVNVSRNGPYNFTTMKRKQAN